MQKLAAAFSRAALWIRAHRWSVLGCFVVLVAVAGITMSAPAIAQDLGREAAAPTGITNTTGWDAAKFAVSVANGSIIVNTLAFILNSLATMVARLTVTLIDAILVPILNYNGYATSQIVDLGWSLVRDTVNMFVVVVLLVIAVLTIVGSDRVNWQQQVPRLFIFTVAVNFSRTICGIAIDVSNVVMFQFVNAILTVGAGNFAQLLQLNYFGQYSLLEAVTFGAAENFATAWLQLALMLAVLGVILVMTVVYLYRIVVLWLLIIMSPLAFFANGIKGIFGPAASIHSEWMKRFTSALLLGPVLTFFLWLSLAAASSGDIITSENFPVGESTDGFGIALKVLEMSNLTGLLLALVLLTVGMSVAGSFASGLGDFAGKLINGGMGATIAKRALRFPALGFREFGRQADRRLGKMIDPHVGSVMGSLGSGVMKSGESVRTWGTKNGVLGAVVGATAGRALSSAGDRMNRQGESMNHEAAHNAEERVKKWSEDRLMSELRVAAAAMAAGKELPLALRNRDAQNEAFTRAMTSMKIVKELEKAEGGLQVIHQGMKAVEEHRDHLKDDQKKAFDAVRSRNVHLMVMTTVTEDPNSEEGAKQLAAREKEREDLRKFLASDKFDPKQLRDVAITVDYSSKPEAETNNLRAEDIEAALHDKVVRTTKDGPITAWDEGLQGAYGKDMRRALELRDMPLINNENVSALPAGGLPFAPDDIKASIQADRLTVRALTANDFAAANPNAESLAMALTEMGQKQIQQLPDATYRAYMDVATRLADVGALSDKDRASIDAQNVLNIGGVNMNPARPTATQVFVRPGAGVDVQRIAEAVKTDPLILQHLRELITAPFDSEKVSAAVAEALTKTDIQNMARLLTSATAEQKVQIQESFENAIAALREHLEKNTMTNANRAEMRQKWVQLRAAAGRAGMADPGDAP